MVDGPAEFALPPLAFDDDNGGHEVVDESDSEDEDNWMVAEEGLVFLPLLAQEAREPGPRVSPSP